MEQITIAIDLGGTNVRVGVVNLTGDILHRISFPTEASLGRERVTDNILSNVRGLLRRFSAEGFEVIGGGFGIPGAIALDRGIVAQSPNLPGWEDYDIQSCLQSGLDMPIFIEIIILSKL